ncbi:hypothetical protein FRC18_003425 [Serendipita sp. 400]|nr:hypothetical protein FRC18_003425 [Serendipita sp. 400]
MPTLNPDTSIHQEIVLVDKTPITVFEYSTIRRGDIVTVRSIDERSQVVVKRVTALAGDKVVRRGTKEVTVIPEGYMWIEGDESFRSRDSNAYGPVPMGLLHGRVVAILWPFNRFGPLRDNRKGT